MKTLSIIIVSYNTRELLGKCLESLIFTDLDRISPNKFEVIVVDNASRDGTIEKLKTQMSKLKCQIRLIENKKNLGFAKAVNQGIKLSQGKYILLLNPDTLLSRSNTDQSSLPKMVAYLEGHPEIAVLGPKIKNLDGSLQPSFGNYPSVITEFFQTFYLHRFFPFGRQICPGIFAKHLFNKPHQVDWLTGACLLIRKEALDQVGLLDEFYFMGVEDIDLCYRIKKVGLKIFYYPEAEILHHHQATTTSYQQAKNRILQESKNLCYFYKKHWPKRRVRFWIFKWLILLRKIPSLIQGLWLNG